MRPVSINSLKTSVSWTSSSKFRYSSRLSLGKTRSESATRWMGLRWRSQQDWRWDVSSKWPLKTDSGTESMEMETFWKMKPLGKPRRISTKKPWKKKKSWMTKRLKSSSSRTISTNSRQISPRYSLSYKELLLSETKTRKKKRNSRKSLKIWMRIRIKGLLGLRNRLFSWNWEVELPKVDLAWGRRNQDLQELAERNSIGYLL